MLPPDPPSSRLPPGFGQPVRRAQPAAPARALKVQLVEPESPAAAKLQQQFLQLADRVQQPGCNRQVRRKYDAVFREMKRKRLLTVTA